MQPGKSKYGVELWTRDGRIIADITPYVRNLYWTEERNEAETLQFSMDLDRFERFMTKAGADPVSNFREGQTEIKVRENGTYLFGTQLYYAAINLNTDGSATINVQASGYLNFFNSRYPDPTIGYTNVEAVEIFYDLVRKAQAVTNGNYGVIIPPTGSYYTTGKLRTQTYEPYTSSTKLNMQRLTSLVDGNFDFRFLPNKTLMTYETIGSPRTDFRINFDRANFRSTIDSATLNRGANNLYNQVIGIGSGLGKDQLLTIRDGLASQIEFGLRQTAVQFNEVSVQSTLIENAQARLAQVQSLLRMPQLTISGADLPAVPIQIGDTFPVTMTGRKLLEDLTGTYRVERREVHVDENHFISSATFYFEEV